MIQFTMVGGPLHGTAGFLPVRKAGFPKEYPKREEYKKGSVEIETTEGIKTLEFYQHENTLDYEGEDMQNFVIDAILLLNAKGD